MAVVKLNCAVLQLIKYKNAKNIIYKKIKKNKKNNKKKTILKTICKLFPPFRRLLRKV